MGVKEFVMRFGVDITELVSGMTAATEAVEASALQMKEAMMSVKESFALVGEAALALGAIMVGGKIFGEMIGATTKLNVESLALGKQFGVSATAASQLKVALNSVFVTQEEFQLAGTKLEKQLKNNEAAFHAVGIATRDTVTGGFRPLLSIMLDTNAYLASVREGTDRGVESARLYGKGFEGVAGTLRITKEAIAAAAKEAEELNLVVTQESESATQQYRASLNSVHEVLEGVKNTIGQEMQPALTEFGNWFRSVGPSVIAGFRIALDGLKIVFGAISDSIRVLWHAFTDFAAIFGVGIGKMFGGEPLSAVEFFTNALKVVAVAFIALRTGIEFVATVVANEFEYLVDLITAWSSVIERAFHLDWAGVKAAWKAGNAKIEADEQEHFQKLVDISKKAAKDIDDTIMGAFGNKPIETPTAAPGGVNTASGNPVKEKSLRDIEKAIKDLDKGYAELEKEHDNQIKLWEEESAEFGKNAAARVAIVQKEVDSEVAAYGRGSAQAIAAMKRLTQEQQKAADQARQIADLSTSLEVAKLKERINEEQRQLQVNYDNHLISAKQLEAGEIALQDRLTQIDAMGLQKRLLLLKNDPIEAAKINTQMQQLELQNEAAIARIKEQAAKNEGKIQQTIYKQMESSFASAISGMLKGTLTLSQAFANMAKEMLNAIIDFLAKWAAQWLVTQIANMVASKTTAAAQIGSQAGVAGAAGTASFAMAPWPIDLGAPAFGAAMAAVAGSFGVTAAAEGGFDIPAGRSGPIVKTHPREMILPEHLSDAVRAMAANGSARSGGAVPVSISALDGHSVRRVLMRNDRDVTWALQKISRGRKI